MDVSIRDFQLVNIWKVDEAGEKGVAEYIIDKSTGRKYGNEPKELIREKCILLTLGTPIVHSIASVVNMAYRIVKLVSLSHFWRPREGEESYNFKARLKDAGKDLARVVMQPFALIGLELAAVYGVFRPLDGRKLYASIERVQYGDYVLAPCFQPDPEKHLFGGNINDRGTW